MDEFYNYFQNLLGSNPDSDVFKRFLPNLKFKSSETRLDVTRRIYIETKRLHWSDMKWLYEHSNAFVLPTHGEGFGLPLIEAMASKIPTISTKFVKKLKS